MLNCYHVHFTTGEVLEYFRPKMTRREYDWIIDGLVEAVYTSGKNSHAKLYRNGIIVALFDAFVWEDGSFDICLYGYPVRHCRPIEEWR